MEAKEEKLRKLSGMTPAELELYFRERCELQNKRVAEPGRARRRQRGNPAPRAMARQRSDKLRAVPLERREEAEWLFGTHAALSDAADAWRETARDRATPPKPGVETPPAAQTRCAPSDAACAAARELAVQRQLRVQRDRVRAPLFAHALAQASAARVAAQAHMHMHLHLTCTCTCTGTCTYSPTCTCPVHNAQALGLEVNKLYRELNGLIGCSFNPLPDCELPRQPWDTQGQCKGKTQVGDRCRVHKSSKYAVAEPLRRGEDFCGPHDPKKLTGVRCAGTKKHGKGRCNVWSGSCYGDAAPLRRGSPYCHHHRVRCAGRAQTKAHCKITSSSENAHAEPLRKGKAFCMHHQCDESSQEEESEGCYIYECEACGELCSCTHASMHVCSVDDSESSEEWHTVMTASVSLSAVKLKL